MRGIVLDRDKGLCRIRLEPWGPNPDQRCQVRADCVHHTKGRAATGDDPAFMIAACTPCNLRIGDPTSIADPEPSRHTEW